MYDRISFMIADNLLFFYLVLLYGYIIPEHRPADTGMGLEDYAKPEATVDYEDPYKYRKRSYLKPFLNLQRSCSRQVGG
jgi:hypothetical protein